MEEQEESFALSDKRHINTKFITKVNLHLLLGGQKQSATNLVCTKLAFAVVHPVAVL